MPIRAAIAIAARMLMICLLFKWDRGGLVWFDETGFGVAKLVEMNDVAEGR